MLVELQWMYSIKTRITWWLRLVDPCSPVIIFLFVLGLDKLNPSVQRLPVAQGCRWMNWRAGEMMVDGVKPK